MKIALIQICSDLDYKVNLMKIDKLILEAKKQAPDLEAIFLPEVFYSMSDGTKATPHLISENNEHFKNIQNIAVKHSLFVLGGTAATDVDGKVINRSYNFSPAGELIESYDKIHLFAVDLKGNTKSTVIDEGKVYTAGSERKTFDLNGFKFGLSICFDLRFPEMFRKYFTEGVNVFTVSSAFTVPTGKAHWETLLRARAIENQSYVIACGQWGEHNDKIKTYGHSMVVDPWGKVLVNCEEGEGFGVCDIDLDVIKKVRGRLDMTPRLS